MGGAIARVRVNPIDVERRLRQSLTDVRLVAEVDLEGPFYEDACEAMAQLVQRRLEASVGRLYPATTAFYLVAEGVHRYRGGSFWPELTVKGVDQTWMGPAFLDALEALGLPTFERETAGGFKYIAKILLHGGIPRYCAADVLRRLIDELRHGGGDAQEIVTKWRASRWDLVSIDKPAQRFLLHGGEEAVDLIDRIVELVHAGAQGASLGPAAFGLPSYLIDEYERLDRSDRSLGKRLRVPKPTLQLDPYSGEGPELHLPRAEVADWFRWHVRSGGGRAVQTFDVSQHRTHRLPVDPPGPWTAEIVGRVNRVTRDLQGVGKVPVWLFDAGTGQLLRNQDRVRADEVLALAPEGFAFRKDGAAGSAVPEGHQLSPLQGQWSRHCVRLLDLHGLSTVWVGSSETVPGVATAEALLEIAPPSLRPQIHGTPIPDVEGPDGVAVFDSWPTIALPPATRPDRWHYRAVINGATHEGVVGELDSFTAGYEVGAVGGSPPLARVDLDILGPLGSDLHTSFVVADGLAVLLPDRVLGPSEPFDVRVEVAEGLRVGDGGFRTAVESAASGVRVELTTRTGDVVVPLTVAVPRLSWSLRRQGLAVPFSDEPFSIAIDEIGHGDDEAIMIRTVRPTSAQLLLRGESDVLQSEGPVTTQGKDGRWAFRLARFLSTARASDVPRLQLVVELDGVRRHVIGELVARHEVRDLEVGSLVEGSETLLTAHWVENRAFRGREVRLWSVARPWDPPVRLPVPDDAGAALELLVDGAVPAGTYTVEVALADGWVTPKRPAAARGDVARVTIGRDADVDDRLRALDPTDPYQYLELLLAERLPARTAVPAALSTLYPALILALVELLEADGWRMLEASRVKRMREALFVEPDQIPAAVDQLVSDGLLDADTVLRLSILTLTDAVDCPLVDADPAARARLFRDAPVLAMALDSWPDDDAGIERWAHYLGWTPADPDGPATGGAVPPFMLGWSLRRLTALRDALDPSARIGLDHDGFVMAMIEWLSREARGFSATRQWCNGHHSLNDYRVRQDEACRRHLDALDPGADAEPAAKFPPILLAAALQAVAFEGQTVKACRALLEAVDFAPALVQRSLLVAVLSHRGALR